MTKITRGTQTNCTRRYGATYVLKFETPTKKFPPAKSREITDGNETRTTDSVNPQAANLKVNKHPDTHTMCRQDLPQSPWATILDLPMELFFLIIAYLDAQCLKSLAFVCGRLGYVILPLIIKGIPHPNTLSLEILSLHNREAMSALPILWRIGCLSSLKGISCDFTYGVRSFHQPTYREVIKDTLRLQFLVQKVTKVEALWIKLPYLLGGCLGGTFTCNGNQELC
jgi:hypothetical protein